MQQRQWCRKTRKNCGMKNRGGHQRVAVENRLWVSYSDTLKTQNVFERIGQWCALNWQRELLEINYLSLSSQKFLSSKAWMVLVSRLPLQFLISPLLWLSDPPSHVLSYRALVSCLFKPSPSPPSLSLLLSYNNSDFIEHRNRAYITFTLIYPPSLCPNNASF